MIVLYTVLVFLLAVAKALSVRRAAALERKYVAAATAANRSLRELNASGRDANRNDPYQTAKSQFLLGQLVQIRDRLEERYAIWQARADRLSGWVEAVRGWKGRKVPYTFGALDVAAVMIAVDRLGVGEIVSFEQLRQLFATWTG